MSNPSEIYALYHIYNREIDGIIEKESKRIGFFETRQQCSDIIEAYKNFKGFRDYPATCFKILEYKIGQEYWRDEFLL